MPSLKAIQIKKELMDELMSLMKEYGVIAAADLRNVKSIQIQEIRKKLRDELFIKAIKSTIVKMTAEKMESERNNIAKFSSLLNGPFTLIFTNLNPYKLIILLNKNKVRVAAKEGDIAVDDITIPAGNTGMPPGPLISEFNEVGIQTRIEEGSIWIAGDALVAKKDEVITVKLASVLSRLGIKPVEAGLSLMAAYDNGSVLGAEDLEFDMNGFKSEVTEALNQAMNLAIYSNYLVKETAVPLLGKAFRQAFWLAVEAEYPSLEAIPETVRRASSIATSIFNKLSAMEKK